MGKEYTYKDWIEGKLEHESLTVLCTQYFFNENHNHSNSFIAPDEIKKIRDAQSDVFDMALKITSSSKVHFLRDKISKVKDPSNWLKIEIDKIEKFMRDNSGLEQRWEEGKREISGITSEKFHATKKIYDDLQERIKSKKPSSAFVWITNGKRESSELFEMYVNKEYLKALYDLKGKYDKPIISLEEKIEIYVNKIKPNSSNKKEYQKAFLFIHDLPSAKDYTNTDLADKILEKFDDLSIKEESLRRIVRPFINEFLE